jgi:beta-glucosidase-like glycosyl hydrolase
MSADLADGAGSGVADLRRAAHRVLMAAFHGPEVPDWLRAGLADGIGSVCLFGTNLLGDDEQLRALAADLHAASPEGCLVTLDEEGGDVTRLDALRGSPTAGHAVLGAVDDPSLTQAVAAGLGARLRSVGIDLDLGPVADVNCEPDNPVIGVRSFGADPHRVARHVAAFVDGLQSSGVAACVKHFPGHGATVDDSHLAVPRLDVDLDTLRARELVPFAAAVRSGAAAVMTSHIVITALDPARPATTSPPVLDILRRELGFDGLLVSDALDMVGVSRPYGGIPDAAVAALAAGCDLLCLGPEHFPGELAPIVATVVSTVLDAVDTGRLTPDRLLEAAARVDTALSRVPPVTDAVRAAASVQAPASAPAPASVHSAETETTGETETETAGEAETETAGETETETAGEAETGGGTTVATSTDEVAGAEAVAGADEVAGMEAVEGAGTDPNVTAARRALHLQTNGVPDLTGAVVIEFDVAPQIAAGPVPWGLARPLAAHVAGIERRSARPPETTQTSPETAPAPTADATVDGSKATAPAGTDLATSADLRTSADLPASTDLPADANLPASTDLPADDDLPGGADLLAGTDGRAVLAVVRNAHRHPWVGDQLTWLASLRPDLITVETGWPLTDVDGVPTGLPGATRLWTYGGSAVSLAAAAAALAATIPPRPALAPSSPSTPSPSTSTPSTPSPSTSTPSTPNPSTSNSHLSRSISTLDSAVERPASDAAPAATLGPTGQETVDGP